MIYYAAFVVALGATFYYALCKAAASADEAARVGWNRLRETQQNEIDNLVDNALDDCGKFVPIEERGEGKYRGRLRFGPR